MGRKFTGHYTLEGVEPGDTVVFLSTGTGEAPQNAMIAELLRRGHKGQILNAVCVRYKTDLAYTSEHAVLSERHRNYTYITLTTREPETINNKVYIQDLISSGRLEERAWWPSRSLPHTRLPVWQPVDDRAPGMGRRRVG